MKMVTGVIWLTPFGVCSVIIGRILVVNDITLVVSQLFWFIVTVLAGVFIYQLIVLQAVYFVLLRKNPFERYFKLGEAILTSFATASTAATLPITFSIMDEKLKVDTRITRFVLPIGANINMDGTSLFLTVASVFIAQMNGVQLGVDELVTIW